MPNQTPEPPRVTDGQIAEWEALNAKEPWELEDEDAVINAFPVLIAEVKRLKAVVNEAYRLATEGHPTLAKEHLLESRAPREFPRL